MLRKIKRLFIEEVPGAQKETAREHTKVANETDIVDLSSEINDIKENENSISTSSKDVDNSRFLDILFNAIEENNIEGFDYLEYKQAIKSLNQVGLDEKTKFQSALAMASALGADVAKIISSAEFYVGILTKEKNKFDQAARNQLTKFNEDKENRPKTLINKIEARKKQIEQLEAERKSIEAELQAVKKDLSETELKINQTQEQFTSAYNHIYNQILSDISKIKNYLG